MNHNQKNDSHKHMIREFKRRLLVSLILTIPVLILSEMTQEWLGYTLKIPYQGLILILLSSVIYFYGGFPFLKGSINELKKRQPGMMTLIAMAISVAFFFSSAAIIFNLGSDFFWELATLIDVMLLGHWIEAKSVMGASRALEELAKIMPTTAHLIKNGNVEDVKVSELKKGDMVLVKPGEKIPSDGIITEGKSDLNESMLTGESKPVSKKPDNEVIGGSINGEGSLKIKIQKTGKETYLAQIIDLVRKSQESKSRSQDIANRAASYLVYSAVFIAIITFIVWTFLDNSFFALRRSVTVLVIACPHALGLAIPLVVALSTTITARRGILVRNRSAFEVARDINAIVFDKTGTLTQGKFGVTDIVSYIDESELLRLTASIESNSEHTIAKAIVEYVKNKNIEIPAVSDFKALSGKGIFGKVEGKEVYAGSPGLLEKFHIKPDDNRIRELEEHGKTVIFSIIDNKLAGVFALSDIIREESYAAISEIKDMGIKTYMITGDAEAVARSVANELGIDDYFAQVLPDKKAEKIQELKKKGFKVAMVGDGINDAPALAASDVGIAIGAGTDVAIESADIVLVKSNPLDVTQMIFLSKRTYAKMIQNLWWAAGYNIIAIPLAAGILVTYGIIVNPAIGALLMSLSTVIVAINSQTLRRYMPESSA